MESIIIPETIKASMIQHAKELLPIESCGYLLGKDNTVARIFQMTNTDHSEDHFSFAPEEQFRAIKTARNAGQTAIGVYHSHPVSPARLSEEDLRLLKDPEMVYIIISLMDEIPDVKAYRIRNKEVSNVKIQWS